MNSFHQNVKSVQHGVNMTELKTQSNSGMINIHVYVNRVYKHHFEEINNVLDIMKTEFSNKDIISLPDIDHNYRQWHLYVCKHFASSRKYSYHRDNQELDTWALLVMSEKLD